MFNCTIDNKTFISNNITIKWQTIEKIKIQFMQQATSNSKTTQSKKRTKRQKRKNRKNTIAKQFFCCFAKFNTQHINDKKKKSVVADCRIGVIHVIYDITPSCQTIHN